MNAPRCLPAAARVLLVNFNSYDQPYPVYPLGLAYIDGALRQAGHQTKIWDGRMSGESLEAAIGRFDPDLVGVSMRNVDNVQSLRPRTFTHEAVDCCRRVRSTTTAPLVVGGSAFSVFPRELFELTGADYGVQGEGERTLLWLIEALQGGRSPDGIPGLYYRAVDGDIRWQPTRPDDAIFSTEPHHQADLLQAYLKHGSLPGIQTQRGCPLRCCYCTYPLIEGRRSRYRTGLQVVEEMRRMYRLGVRYAFFVDSVFNTRPDHVAEICEALIRADLDMGWECFLRPHNVSRELLQLMQRAGLRHVEFGSDSFSDSVLECYGKSFTFDDICEASGHAHALGLNYCHFIIFGGPGETPATVEETLARAQTLPGAYYFTMIGMRIYPNTPLWRSFAAEKQGETAARYVEHPCFYLAPEFTVEGLHARLAEVRKSQHNWIIGDPPPEFLATMNKLRGRGAQGPMWEYIEVLQRLAQQ